MQHFVLSSCSNKNDDDWIIDGLPDPVTIDLSKVFTNGTPKEVDSMTIQTNEKGLAYKYLRLRMKWYLLNTIIQKHVLL